MIKIYTDGACLGNPGPGGWAAIVVEGESKRVLHGRQDNTTNNRMELMAVIEGVRAVPESSEVTVFSDSQYVVNTMTRNWKRNANKDLWTKLDTEVGKRVVNWQWIRGHAGYSLNEEADSLANQEAVAGRANISDATLTHIDESGKARMVDVSQKLETERVAVAKGSVVMQPETLQLIRVNGFEKGDVLGVAKVAGILGAKHTWQLVPLCHPISLDQISIDFDFNIERNAVEITAAAKTTSKTGVEMEALTAVSVAGLTIYDMCKSVDRAMHIDGVRVVRKSGGISGDVVFHRTE